MAAQGARSRAVLVAAAILVGLCTGRVHAGAPALASAQDVPRPSASPALSLDQAVRLVEHRYQGRVVRAETESADGRTLYLLRVLDDGGHVRSVRVDADSGAVL